jgi:hypothetical protein
MSLTCCGFLLLPAHRNGRYLLTTTKHGEEHGKHGKHAEEVTTTTTGDHVEETVTGHKKKHGKAGKVSRAAVPYDSVPDAGCRSCIVTAQRSVRHNDSNHSSHLLQCLL